MNAPTQNITNFLRTGSFLCQELVVSHTDIQTIASELLDLQRRFTQTFTNLNVVVNLTELPQANEEHEVILSEIKECLIEMGHNVVGVIGVKNSVANAVGLKMVRPKQEEAPPKPPKNDETPPSKVIPETQDSTDTLIMEQSIRGGQTVYAKDKNLVVIGDVKRGAEIAADGNITIFGKFEGRAHAGVNGNVSATITANKFDPELASISGIYIANQDVDKNNFGKHVLVMLNPNENKIVIKTAK